MTKPICLALQGGGAHGAFTWGVLDHLLERQATAIRAVSGTSAGAMNAAALVNGLVEGGAEAARRRLSGFWKEVARRSPLGAAERQFPFKRLLPFADTMMTRSLENMKLFGQLVSPYQSVTPPASLLKQVIGETIDLDLVASQEEIPLFISATDVQTGEPRLFTGPKITSDSLLASACLPNLFKAVEIDGRFYWDGGYMGNPMLSPLFSCGSGCTDLLIVQVTPFEREDVPRSRTDIMDRVNEITFNASLMRDLKTIADIKRLSRDEAFENPTLRTIADLRVHMIAAGPELAESGSLGKLDTRMSSLNGLADLGRRAAERWFSESYGSVGECTTAPRALEVFSEAPPHL